MKNTFAYRAQNISIERVLALRPEIENFHAEYCAVLDQNQVELWPDFFAEDGLYRATSRENAELG
ncbi:MAG: nuclear transport factor 2 family protein, partial [Advenella sp.]